MSLFRSELVKQTRRPRTYVGMGIMIAIPVIIVVALKANPPSAPDSRDSFFYFSRLTGLIVPVASLEVMSRFLLIAIVSMFAGDAIASEASWGNLRSLLVRPVRRGSLLAAKFGVVAILTIVATALIVITGLIAGVIAFGWHPLNVSLPGQLGLHQSIGALLGHLVYATGYVIWDLAAIVAFGFMVSTMTDAPAGAIGAAFGLYVTSSILDNISAIGSIRYGFPTHYFDSWTDLFSRGSASADMARGALLQIPYLIVFLGIAWWWFRRKDILS